MKRKKIKLAEYMKDGPKFDERMWEACEITITKLYPEMKDAWADIEYRSLTRKYRKKKYDSAKLKKMAQLIVAREYRDSKDEMILGAYRKAVREKYET